MVVAVPLAHPAVFVPGSEAPAPDPPTGVVQREAAPSAEEPLQGGGIRWRLAPPRTSGAITLDLRALRQETGTRNLTALAIGEIDMASHVWQPWFLQLRLGLTAVTSTTSGDEEGGSGRGLSLAGRAVFSLFPVSRFPFELRVDMTDSRTDGLNLGGDHKTRRVSMSQGWRPQIGSLNLHFTFDHSTIAADGVHDTLDTFAATATNQIGAHYVDFSLSHSQHELEDTGQRNILSAISARHGYHPSHELQVDTMASWNRAEFDGLAFAVGSELRQISSLLSWRSAVARGPTVTASARWVESSALGLVDASAQALNATLGATMDLTREWRASASASANELRTEAAGAENSVGLQASLAWAPASLAWLGWRWSPSAATSGGISHDSRSGDRKLLGVQFSHALSREFALGRTSALSLAFSQSLAALHESATPEPAYAIAHGASLGWQSSPESNGRSSQGGLSWSKSRTLGSNGGSFEIVNLQLGQRAQLTRYSGWSASLTAQATRNRGSELDAFTGERREFGSDDWQPFYGGMLTWDHQRLFDVPRLRAAVILAANSFQLERRAAGDIDAPRERVSASLEGRLDWSVGRLETRLAARAARIEGRSVAAIQARAQRRF